MKKLLMIKKIKKNTIFIHDMCAPPGKRLCALNIMCKENPFTCERAVGWLQTEIKNRINETNKSNVKHY